MDTSALVDIGSLIHFPAARYGPPCLAGTGMYVFRVVDLMHMGMTRAQMQAEFDHIPLSHFFAALAFYFANQQWCDDFMTARDVEAERLFQEHVERAKVGTALANAS